MSLNKYFIYARRSTDEIHRQVRSIEAQLEELRELMQRYTENGNGGASIWVARKDGNDIDFMTEDVYRVHCPFHVSIESSLRLEELLVNALMKAREGDLRASLDSAIFAFNRANTDNPTVTSQSEVVMLNGAMEVLLGCPNGKVHDLLNGINDLFQPSRRIPLTSCARIPRDSEARSVAEVWAKDFFVLRGNLGHGRKHSPYKSKWSMHEHLLLGAYFFPLLVKLKLNRDQLYDLSIDDKRDIEVFEELACADLFKKEIKDGVEEWPWNRIRSNMLIRHFITKVIDRE